MENAAKSLPQDVEKLQGIIAQQAGDMQSLRNELERLRLQNGLLHSKLYGRASEKRDYLAMETGQGDLFNEAEHVSSPAPELSSDDNTIEVPSHTRKKQGRKPLPTHLPRMEVLHDIAEPDKQCACGHVLHRIGEQVSEQLEYIPAQTVVLVHKCAKYGCRHCESVVKTAKKPAQPIPKSIATPGLLAQIVTAKYQDALPLHRQEKQFARIGVELPRAKMAHWMIKCGELIVPLLNLLKDELLESHLIHSDETPVQVLKEPGKSPHSKSYMWVQARWGPQPIVLFDYASSRSSEIPKSLLTGYNGILQTDGYAAYNAVCQQFGITQVGCWDHARRKFTDAVKVYKQANKVTQKFSTPTHLGLSLIGKLYTIERHIADLDSDAKHEARQMQSRPVIEKLRAWLDKYQNKVPPKSPLGLALGYLAGQWTKLVRFLDDGRIPLSNMRAENCIRPFVVGRKNWLFSDTVNGAVASARLYSLVETAKANGHEPYAYLRHVFTKIPNLKHDYDLIETLLPWNIQPQDIKVTT